MAQVDKFARDAETWRCHAEDSFSAARRLFNINDPSLWFSAALLAHHALEMLLKAALIREGFTVAKGKPQDGFVWGHSTEELAQLLNTKRPDFSLNIRHRRRIPLISCPTYLARYDAIFNELRYPSASPNVDSLGPGEHEAELLAELINRIRPFAVPVSQEEPQP